MIDVIDRKILSILQSDARISNAKIARQLRMAPSAILQRIRKLRNKGVIREYVTRLDPKSVDFGLMAYISIKTNEKRAKWDVGELVSRIPEVLEVHDVAGEDCYLVKLRTKDTESLFRLLRDEFGKIEAVESTRTTIVLRTVKETTKIPFDEVISRTGKRNRNSGSKG